MFEFTMEQNKCLHFNLRFYFYIEIQIDSTPPPFSKDGLLSAQSGFGLQFRVQISASLEAGEIWISER